MTGIGFYHGVMAGSAAPARVRREGDAVGVEPDVLAAATSFAFLG